jgi:hypothetical protein
MQAAMLASSLIVGSRTVDGLCNFHRTFGFDHKLMYIANLL